MNRTWRPICEEKETNRGRQAGTGGMVWILDRGQDGEQTKQPQTQSQERAENLTRTQLGTQRIGKERLERPVCLSGGGDEHIECTAGVEEATGRSPGHCPVHPGK